MKQSKTGRYVLLSVLGFIIMCAGLCLVKWLPEPDGLLKTVPYIFVGIGAGIFGSNLGTALTNKALLKNPQAAKQTEIELKDERNQTISNKAKARAYDLMLYVYAAVLLGFTVMEVSVNVILTLVAVYLFFVFANIYYLSKYHKEM